MKDFILQKPLPYQIHEVYRDVVTGLYVMLFKHSGKYYVVHDYVVNKDADAFDLDVQFTHGDEELINNNTTRHKNTHVWFKSSNGRRVEGIGIGSMDILLLDIHSIAYRFKVQVLDNDKS